MTTPLPDNLRQINKHMKPWEEGPRSGAAETSPVDLDRLFAELTEAGFSPAMMESKKNGMYVSFQPYAGVDLDVWEDGEVQLGERTIPWEILDRVRKFLPEGKKC